MIKSVGLAPTKSKNVVNLSKALIERFGGEVPSSQEDLMSLPGVAPKTAAVVTSQWFGEPAFPVDTHVHRLALRWELTKNEKQADRVSEDLRSCFPREKWNKLHLQFIYFGREHCTAKSHDPNLCPICCWVKNPQCTAIPSSPGRSSPPGGESPRRTNTPTKHKGIIFYSERTDELLQSNSPLKRGLPLPGRRGIPLNLPANDLNQLQGADGGGPQHPDSPISHTPRAAGKGPCNKKPRR